MANLRTRIDVNLTQFFAKVKEIQKISNRTLPDELNKQMLQLIVGAKGSKGLVQLTDKATEARIRADLAKVVTYSLPGGRSAAAPLGRLLAAKALRNKGTPRTHANLDAMVKRITDARVNHRRAYIAASWLFAARQLAQSVAGNTLSRMDDIPMNDSGTAAGAFDKTKAAVPKQLKVVIFNTAIGADKVAQKAIPRALGNATRDMAKYIGRKLGEAFARVTKGGH